MVELAHILRQFGPAYQRTHQDSLLPSHRRAMYDIGNCRTPVFGGHLYTCLDCPATQYSYHSCQNRHCPKCQHQAGQAWLLRQQELLLPVPYFLLTFTLPAAIRSLARSHQKLIYTLLFRASATATQQLAQDSRFVGGQLGMIGVLHTWGRNLAYHPHVHHLVPAGGLDGNGRWQPSRHNFLVPVRALSVLFRAKFRDALKQTPLFDQIPASVWQKSWVVHCKPVGDGRAALRYLAPYIFRVAISNRRILKLSNGKVSFRYFASETGKPRTCTVTALEFIRRFLSKLVLPMCCPRGLSRCATMAFLRRAYAAICSRFDSSCRHLDQHRIRLQKQPHQPMTTLYVVPTAVNRWFAKSVSAPVAVGRLSLDVFPYFIQPVDWSVVRLAWSLLDPIRQHLPDPYFIQLIDDDDLALDLHLASCLYCT